MYNKYTSPLGFQTGGTNMIDIYGVNHSGFGISDELAYGEIRPITTALAQPILPT